jgi:hypothetical protein
MRESRLVKAWSQGCARSLALRIIVSIGVIGGFFCLAVTTALAPIEQDYKIFVWVGLVVLFLFVVIGAVIAWGVWTIRKRATELDKAFVPLGLDGRMYMQNGRQYHGTYRGYKVHAYFYRGPTIDIYLDVPLKTRVGIGRKGSIERAVANILEKVPLSVDDPEFEHLVVYPMDQAWAGKLLANPQARIAIRRLTAEGAETELRSLSVTPQALLLKSRYIPINHITPDLVRNIVNDLYEFARIAEGLTPPTITAEESKIERASRSDRSKFTWPIIGITCGFFAIMTVCILGITAVLIFIDQSGL